MLDRVLDRDESAITGDIDVPNLEVTDVRKNIDLKVLTELEDIYRFLIRADPSNEMLKFYDTILRGATGDKNHSPESILERYCIILAREITSYEVPADKMFLGEIYRRDRAYGASIGAELPRDTTLAERTTRETSGIRILGGRGEEREEDWVTATPAEG